MANDEHYYCGACNSQQQPSQGERCRGCNRVTVSWYPNRQTAEEAFKHWVSMRAYFNEPPYTGKPGRPWA
ncbi:MAG TPA: hypothetical protein IGS17_20750 [Oscillatoriales cyanobacterium M59_W2019_021]|nr:MAG: hypothetical protein D6728_00160 [Cyanobacteria bacterium J055]HIK31500.1 hypothetical protein [Oscillatoriales cyanobacterium M4454_W2019_049]HIK53321.1 hypothetical protein [Oscillatoriales cyanobacterium M59_W2019_021]